jgi:hypothetical protein
MLRRVFTLLSALSLLLCVAVVVLWVRSCWVGDRFERIERLSREPPVVVEYLSIGINRGRVWASRYQETYTMRAYGLEDGPKWKHSDDMEYVPLDSSDVPSLSPIGLGWKTHTTSGRFLSTQEFWLVVPIWLLLVLFAVLPGAWLVRRRCASRRSMQGQCGECGYDLRATPGRCPECGAVPKGVPISN